MALVKLYVGRDSLDAHHVRAHLESCGIRAAVLGEFLSVARGDLPLTPETLPAVFVNKEDIDAALAVMREFENNKPSNDPTLRAWVCPQCKETIERQFDICWNCGATRPDDGGPPPLPTPAPPPA